MQRPYSKMPGSRSDTLSAVRNSMSVKVVVSYVLDWVVLVIFAVIAGILGIIEPHKRPFSLSDPEISYPFTEHELVPAWLLVVLAVIVPIVIVAVVSLVFVPGATVPKNTPASLVWKRKLWELHVGWMGLALSLVSVFFFTQGMKNLFGKPRPDLLSRCEPDLSSAAKYAVGGFPGENTIGQLYSAAICKNPDSKKLDDGFRSYPSGHSSSSAAGLVYLALFLASKFGVTIPFAVPNTASSSHAAFPSRAPSGAAEPLQNGWDDGSMASSPVNTKIAGQHARHNANIQSLRLQAAAPPIYLLAITLAPFCLSIFIASSRWYDYRHHGFDILFGYIMGLITAIYSFRYYHMPIQHGAGWAWGPRSSDRAFWAGVGRLGYASDQDSSPRPHTLHGRMADSNDVELRAHQVSGSSHMTQRPTNDPYGAATYGDGTFDDVEMHRMGTRA